LYVYNIFYQFHMIFGHKLTFDVCWHGIKQCQDTWTAPPLTNKAPISIHLVLPTPSTTLEYDVGQC
jgi:hypothetical protein